MGQEGQSAPHSKKNVKTLGGEEEKIDFKLKRKKEKITMMKKKLGKFFLFAPPDRGLAKLLGYVDIHIYIYIYIYIYFWEGDF